jgi:hypothetical protein
MRKKIEMLGLRFGKWTVNEESRANGRLLWKCVCDCGTERDVSGFNLRSGESKSCGKCWTPANTYSRHPDGYWLINCVGACFKIDDIDFPTIQKYKWYVNIHGYIIGKKNNRNFQLHRFIMKAPDGVLVDHISGDKQDNRRDNLRFCTKTENAQNSKKQRGNRTGYKGIWYHKHRSKYYASIRVNGKQKHLGVFNTDIEAAHAYDKAALFYFGEFARVNFAMGGNKQC